MIVLCALKWINRILIGFSIIGQLQSCARGREKDLDETDQEQGLGQDSDQEQDDVVLNLLTTPSIKCEITQWYENRSCTVNFTWDDANPTHVKIDSIFDKFDFNATYFIQTSAFSNENYRLLYQSISKRGNEIASHTVMHYYLKDIPLSQVEDELKTSSEDIFNYFKYYPATFAHPGSVYNEDIDSLVGLYYLDSRYSSRINTQDRMYLGFRTKQNGKFMTDVFDNFMRQNKCSWFMFGGHGVAGVGYEPIDGDDLGVLLGHIRDRYLDKVWVTTFANTSMYKFLRENISLRYGRDFVFCDRNSIKKYIQKYSNANSVITLRFPDSKNISFSSSGIVQQEAQGNDQLISLDIRKSRIINFEKHE